MESLEVIKVLQLLGTGLSVQSLVDKLGITYEHLCELAGEYPMLSNELYRWYPKWDFTVKHKEEPKVEDLKEALEKLNQPTQGEPVIITTVETTEKVAEEEGIKLDKEKLEKEGTILDDELNPVKPLETKKKSRKKKQQV